MKKVDKARNIFNVMVRSGAVPDSYTYNTLIKALCDERRIHEAKEILLAMESSGCSATNNHSYWPIVGALTKMG